MIDIGIGSQTGSPPQEKIVLLATEPSLPLCVCAHTYAEKVVSESIPWPSMVVHMFNSSIWESEAGRHKANGSL